MTNYDKAPDILVQKTPNGILPYNEFSQDEIAGLANGQVFKAAPRKGRKESTNGAYWIGINTAVKATDAWPTQQHLHDDLKRLCGYVDTYHNPLKGCDEIRVQSTAFAKMSEPEFKAYFQLAQAKFIAAMDFDPWARPEGNK